MRAHNLPRAKMTMPIGYCSRYLLMQTFFPGCGGLILPIRISFRYSVTKMKIMSQWHKGRKAVFNYFSFFLNSKRSFMTSLPEIQSFLQYLFQVCLVYITGLIVWVWCNRNPDEGLNAVQQTDRVALKSGTRSSSMVMAGHSSSHSGLNGAKNL